MITRIILMILGGISLFTLNSCCTPPPAGYESKPETIEEMNILAAAFMKLLPEHQRNMQEAKEEAAWLSRTAYTESAHLAREYKTLFIGWANNALVNAKTKDRGLCWQYQQDLFRELRRRPLKYFHIGLTVRDQARGREHNCVYINRIGGKLPTSLVLDPWATCGYLQVLTPEDRTDAWKESSVWERRVSHIYPEGHGRSKKHHIRN